jgi:hypothetical protein
VISDFDAAEETAIDEEDAYGSFLASEIAEGIAESPADTEP